MLQAQKVSKSFGEQQALREISLKAASGQCCALIGPSGCGKSTLLRMFIGLIKPDLGQVLIDGEVLNAANLTALRHKIGYVIQEGGLFPHLTARANIVLLARHLNWTSGAMDERVGELASLTDFPASGLDRFPAELSGGQRQRVSLMRALMLDPDLLLLDEPLGALDPMIRADLQTDLRQIFQKLQKTVVLVTHDIGEAGYLADTIVLMREGQIVQQGSLAELVQQPADPFVANFINAQRSPLESLQNRTGGSE